MALNNSDVFDKDNTEGNDNYTYIPRLAQFERSSQRVPSASTSFWSFISALSIDHIVIVIMK